MKWFERRTKPCFAEGCDSRISRRMLMCRKHWDLVPNSIQFAVYNTLEIWESGGSPRLYLDVIKRARIAVAQKEARLNERESHT
ncbi:MAG: hypothetical protein P4K93_07570 [Terracidiphilus sp.]|nr:hypothetical protein [Terracidiphilus sp.]